jgi:serine/threonine-protein kinase
VGDVSRGTSYTVADTDPADTEAAATSDTPATFDRFRVNAVLGRGGMGEVLSARDERIGRWVAIKRLRERGARAEVIARFLREARIQARLEHPAIVPVHELHDTEDDPYFVMKQITGASLDNVIASRPRNVLLRAFVEVCLAIEFAHSRGVIHRDLKPSNIMLGDFGEVYVVDWGIARVIGDAASRTNFAEIDTVDRGATVPGSVLGTPGYISPEQIRGDTDLDGRSDVYALGCILFEILAGRPLHPRGLAGLTTALAGVDAHASLHRDVPPELDDVCVKATAIDRDTRFTSARALADAVQRYLDGDRDLALRRDLARADLDRAREALARNDRAEALRAAGRALALDPQARDTAELVTRLMLEQPAQTPSEVEHELQAAQLADIRRQSLRGGLAMFVILLFVPLMYLSGLHDTWYIATLIGADVLAVVLSRIFVVHTARWLMWPAIAIAMAVLVVVARETTPILIAPSLTIISASLLSTRARPRTVVLIYVLTVAAMLVPWGLEVMGYLPRTVEVVGDAVVLHAPTTHLVGSVTLPGFALWVIVAPAVAMTLTRQIARDHSRLQRSLHLRAWQLRQIMPRG